MKKLIFVILFAPVLALAQEKPTYYAGAGATLNNYQGDVIDNLGAYASFGTTGRLTNIAGYLGEVQLTGLRGKPYSLFSLSTTFAYRVFPIKKLSVDLGFQLAFHVVDNWDMETSKPGKGRMDGVAGLQYQLSDKLGVSARYNHHITDLPFKGYGQLGITYGF